MCLALARATGWPEHYIMHLPLARVLSYLHANMLANGIETDWAVSTEADQAQVDDKMGRYLKR